MNPTAFFDLTPRQRQTLDIIVASVEERGYPPTYKEIVSGLGLSPNSQQYVHELLDALESKGAIAVDRMRSRAIRVAGVRWRMVPDNGVKET